MTKQEKLQELFRSMTTTELLRMLDSGRLDSLTIRALKREIKTRVI